MLEDYLEPIKEKVTGKRFTEKEGTILSQISGRFHVACTLCFFKFYKLVMFVHFNLQRFIDQLFFSYCAGRHTYRHNGEYLFAAEITFNLLLVL